MAAEVAKAFTGQKADIVLQNLKTSASLKQNRANSSVDRAAEAILTACKIMAESGMMDFMKRDAAFLPRKILADLQEKHCHSDEVLIKELLSNAELEPAGGMALTADTVRGLFLTVSHRENIGPLYPQVLDTLVRGSCPRLFPEN